MSIAKTQRLGKRQMDIIRQLCNDRNKYIEVFNDYGTQKSDITLTDSNNNDYEHVPRRIFNTLLERRVIELYESVSMCIHNSQDRYRLNQYLHLEF